MNLLTEKQISKNQIEWENCRHVYFLLKNDQVVYIGQCSKSIPNLFSHSDKDFTHFFIQKVGDDEDINLIQAEYIINLIPKYSGFLPTNDIYMTKNQMKKRFNIGGFEINRLIKKNGANTVYRDYYDVREVFLNKES